MTSRERIRNIIAGEPADRVGFWMGNPHADTWPILHGFLGTTSEEEVRLRLGDDLRWIAPWQAYKHPQGLPMWDMRRRGSELSAGGAFADCEDPREVDDHPWPDPEFLDFAEVLSELRAAGDVYRAGGFWCPFFHEVADFFGMENYFVKMYTNPAVVHAVTGRMIDFYLEANRRLFDAAGDLIDAFFFGNDFGTQLDLLISPELFREFVAPYFRKLTDLGHARGYQVILHSCGAVRRVIPDLIAMGVDALHPIQAMAAGMDAETLAREFGDRLAFMGGIDTQRLLVRGTPDDVRREVRRVRGILGPRLILSPSHEALLPNVPPENVLAMSEASREPA